MGLSKAKFLGHPAHQMLIVFPLGLLATAVSMAQSLFLFVGWLAPSRVESAFFATTFLRNLINPSPGSYNFWRLIN
jgi:hypothetical protein